MPKKEISEILFYDAIAMRRKGFLQTADALDDLSSKVLKSESIHCGSEEEIREKQEKPQLFLPESSESSEDDFRIRLLPCKSLLLDYTFHHEAHAGLVLASALPALEIFVFRRSAQHNRWIWPFIGMMYGPSPKDIRRVAVFEPKLLAKMPDHAMNAMVHEHALDAHVIHLALTLFWDDIPKTWTPKKEKPVISPSSFARRKRVQHKKRGSVQGSHRA